MKIKELLQASENAKLNDTSVSEEVQKLKIHNKATSLEVEMQQLRVEFAEFKKNVTLQLMQFKRALKIQSNNTNSDPTPIVKNNPSNPRK